MLVATLPVSNTDNPSLKTRMRVLSIIFVSLLLLLPMISLFNTASILQFSFFALFAKNCAPNKPCSSPLTVTKITVAGKPCWLITLAHSITAAEPLPSSFAPGESFSLSISLLRLESICPLIKNTRLSLGSVPFNVANTFPRIISLSTLLPSGL